MLPTWPAEMSASEGVEDEITLPGVVGGPGSLPEAGAGATSAAPQAKISLGAGLQAEPETASDEEDVSLI